MFIENRPHIHIQTPCFHFVEKVAAPALLLLWWKMSHHWVRICARLSYIAATSYTTHSVWISAFVVTFGANAFTIFTYDFDLISYILHWNSFVSILYWLLSDRRKMLDLLCGKSVIFPIKMRDFLWKIFWLTTHSDGIKPHICCHCCKPGKMLIKMPANVLFTNWSTFQVTTQRLSTHLIVFHQRQFIRVHQMTDFNTNANTNNWNCTQNNLDTIWNQDWWGLGWHGNEARTMLHSVSDELSSRLSLR